MGYTRYFLILSIYLIQLSGWSQTKVETTQKPRLVSALSSINYGMTLFIGIGIALVPVDSNE